MTLVLIIGTITSVVGFLLLHQRLDKELGARFLYSGVGASIVSVSGFALNLVSTESIRIYPVLQFVFLCLGVVHALLIFRYDLLGKMFAQSNALTTMLTLVLLFGAGLGFSLVSTAFLRTGSTLCATCVLPFAIPFFVYQTYQQFQFIPRDTVQSVVFNHRIELPPEESDELVRLKFYVPKRYTGLKGIKGLERSFPAHWKISDAFHEFILVLCSRDSKIILDEQYQKELLLPSEWVLYTRHKVLLKKYIDPSQVLSETAERRATTIYVKRLRFL